MSNPIEDTRTLIKMGTAQRILAKRLATMVLTQATITPEMLELAELIANPTPEHQPMLLAVATEGDGPSAA